VGGALASFLVDEFAFISVFAGIGLGLLEKFALHTLHNKYKLICIESSNLIIDANHIHLLSL